MNEEHEPRRTPGRARNVFGIALPLALVLGAVGGGLAYTRHTVDTADRNVTTTLWSGPKEANAKDPAAGFEKGRAHTPLGKLLMPVPESYHLGPDIADYGNDGELSGKAATALIKESGRGLAGKKRRAFDKRIDELGVQGIAMRSYVSYGNDLVLEVQIVRMKDTKEIHDLHQLRTDLAEALDMKKGPKIEGHKKASCFVRPLKKDGGDAALESMHCASYANDLQVAVKAYGTKPLDRSEVADLVKDQLDHIASPGEYI
ncbi:hypothetical protein [Streptomyces sp. NPDC006307]|uniref:hypothetical protein n=1 Tax=Streptomyces sp. NPDC006307 TaxID=3156748 RepID=UPI0033AB7F71